MTDVGLCSEKERWLNEVPKDQADELWPPPLWPGHFCRRSFLQLRDSAGLSAQQPPYSFAVRYDLRPLSKQMSGVSAYLMLMDGESLRRIGKGSGLDLVAAAKSWIARHALCAPPQLLARDADGKLTGEVVAQPDPHLYGNGEGVLLMSVVLTADLKDWRDWRPVGDLMSYRLGSPPVQCGLCGMAVAQRDLLAHQKECLEVMIPCPRCGKRVLIRELSAHQKGRDCLSQLVMSTQTEDLETEDVGSQCVTPALLPVAVQTSYASALLAPSIRAEEAVPALVPSLAIRWQVPPSQVRQMLTEYQLTVSEFMGGDERWKHLRVELLDIERLEKLSGLSNGELRHELTNLRPGTKYRLELQLRAVDGCLGPKAQVTLHTLSRLAGFEGLSEDERLHLASAMVPEGPAQRPESLSVREQATQAGPGFVTGACKSEISREVGVQAFPKIFTETACQIDPLVAIQKDTASGPEWPLLSHCAVQCKVLPEAVDTSAFSCRSAKVQPPFRSGAQALDNFLAHKPKQSFTFLSMFKWEPRKNWYGLLESFLEAFPEQYTSVRGPNGESRNVSVRLLVKTQILGWSPDDPRQDVPDLLREKRLSEGSLEGRLLVFHDFLNSSEIPKLFKAVDGFILPTHGEGWGLPLIEAMASGIPTISTGWGGHMDFMSKENSWPVSYDLVESQNYGARWAEPRKEALMEAMREVVAGGALVRGKVDRGCDLVHQKYHIDAVANQAVELMIGSLEALHKS